MVIFKIISILLLFSNYIAYSQTNKLEQLEKDIRKNFQKTLQNKPKTDEVLTVERDINSHANLEELKILRYDLELEIDFEEEKLVGQVTIEGESLVDLKEFSLDAWKIRILKNERFILSVPEPYEIPLDDQKYTGWQDNVETSKLYGGNIVISFENHVEHYKRDNDGEIITPRQKLKGYLPANTLFFITIPFETTNDYEGIGDRQNTPPRYSFVKAEHTHGQEAPFFYTQNSPIYARTIFPCWDTPQSWSQLDMKLKVKKSLGLTIYSNQTKDQDRDETEGDFTVAYFNQLYPLVTTHQIAIVVGKLVETKVTDRVFILSDDEEVNKKAVEKLGHISEWVDITETIVDLSFAWDRLEFIIMPPSYPYEGNQQQQLTYVSPSILDAGSTGAAVIIHEIASNFFGNVVQAGNWQNLWINEGVSTYIERLVKKEFYGSEYNNIDKIIGNFTLYETFRFIDINQLEPSFKSLYPNTDKINPDEIINEVPFEKGYQLLEYLEQLLKFPFKVCKILQQMIKKYEFKSIDYKMFQQFTTEWIVKEYGEKDGEAINDQIDWELWIKGEGFPPENTLKKFESKEYNQAIELANKFLQFDGTSRPKHYKDLEQWDEDQKYAFLDFFLKHNFMVNQRLIKQLDQCYDFKSTKNLNLLSTWLTLTSYHRYNTQENEAVLRKFIESTGRLTLILPVYEALAQSGQRTVADKFLLQQADFYHYVAIEAIEATIFRTTM